MDEAMTMAVDCLAGRLWWFKQDGDIVPPPSPINSIDPTSIAKEHFDKSVRKTLTIPAWLNTAALEMDINFSQVLQEALLAKVRSR